MTSSWVKMRTDLPRDPRVLSIAEHLARHSPMVRALTQPPSRDGDVTAALRPVTVALAVTSLLRIWTVAREQARAEGDDQVLDCAGLDTLDHLAEVPGFGQAMAFVGWAVEETDDAGRPRVRFPKLLRHNVAAEDRLKEFSAERSRRYRQRRRDRDQAVRDPHGAAVQPNGSAGPSDGVTPASRDGHVTASRNSTVQYSTSPPNPQGGDGASLSPSAPGKKRKRETEVEAVAKDPGFQSFWAAYPKRAGKYDAQRAWLKIKPAPGLVEVMLRAVAAQVKTDQWQRDGGQYIPHPATWLNGHKWEDEVGVSAPVGHSADQTLADQARRKAERRMRKEQASDAGTVRASFARSGGPHA
ncbi:MAG: hypothetical protein U0797_12880 [Gemmataceae bacterium]